MEEMYRIQDFKLLKTNLGDEICYTYSILNSDGNIKEGNVKGSFYVVDNDLEKLIKGINEAIMFKINPDLKYDNALIDDGNNAIYDYDGNILKEC